MCHQINLCIPGPKNRGAIIRAGALIGMDMALVDLGGPKGPCPPSPEKYMLRMTIFHTSAISF